MRYAFTIAAFAAAANAGVIFNRGIDIVTVTEIQEVWTTVTIDPYADPTPDAKVDNAQAARIAPDLQAAASISSAAPAVSSAPPAPEIKPVVAAEKKEDPKIPVVPKVAEVAKAENKPAAVAAAAPAPDTYSSGALGAHNAARAKHGAPPLAWDAGLAATALKIAKTCQYGHSMDVDGGKYGQNIAAGAAPDKIGQTVITDQFYGSEVVLYKNYGQPTPADFSSGFSAWGHFTQIVWKDTKSVGCASYTCGSLSGVSGGVPPVFHVCNYAPAGNFKGAFDKNVLPPQ